MKQTQGQQPLMTLWQLNVNFHFCLSISTCRFSKLSRRELFGGFELSREVQAQTQTYPDSVGLACQKGGPRNRPCAYLNKG